MDEIDEQSNNINRIQDIDMSWSADELSDSALCPSPSFMKNRLKTLRYNVDPAIVPIQSSEVAFLVRFLYQMSSKLNIMVGFFFLYTNYIWSIKILSLQFHRQLNDYWHRNDVVGRMVRQLLYPPMVVHSFDKSRGYSRAIEDRLPARVNLRFLASYQSLVLLLVSFAVGQLMFGAPSYGFFALILCTFVYTLLMSFINDPK